MRLLKLAALVSIAACSGSAARVEPPPASPVGASASPTPLAPARPASPPPVVAASAAPAPKTPPPPKVVLQLGDSMVGGYEGLAKALAPKFEALGAKFYRSWQRSVGIATYDHEHTIDDLIEKRSPDLVIVTLGANDVSVPFPSVLAKNVQSIVRRVSSNGRACYWLLPPLWKKDTGIVEVIKQNAAPCKVFDASHLKIARRADGIHPSNAGGATWADAFFAYYEGNGPAAPNAPPSAVAAR